MAKSMGYPLPEGEAYTDELACMMIFYPDKDRYRQAFMSAYFYFGNWLAWEKETDKKGKDAARAWKQAIEVTLGCIEMNTCETILSLLTEIRDNTGVYCCDVVDVSDGDRYTDEVEDGVGDVPQNIIDAGYATGVSDWTGFDEYKCMISHLMIQNMQSQTAKFLSWFDGTEAILITVAAVAAVALAIFTAGGAILAYGIALSVAGVAGLYAAATLLGEVGLSSLVDNLGDHYDDLVCAVYFSDGSVGAVVALKDAIDEHFNAAEAVYLKSLNLAPQLKALYAGRYDAQDIAEKMADEGYDVGDYDCTCPIADESYLATFDADEEEWNVYPPNDSKWENQGNPAGGIYHHWALGRMDLRVGDIQVGAGVSVGDDIEVVQVSLDYKKPASISPDGVSVTFDPSYSAQEIIKDGAILGSWVQMDFRPASPILMTYNIPALNIVLDGGTGSSGKIDNVRVWFNTV